MANMQGPNSTDNTSAEIEDQNDLSSRSGERLFEIHVKGHLNREWSDWLGGLEIKLLENARLALNQEGSAKDFADSLKNLKKLTENSKKRLEILARDRKAGLEVPSKEYFKAGGYWPGVSDEMPTATNVEGGAAGGGNVVRLNVQRGSTAGSSTLQPAELNFSAFEGKVLNTPDGKRVRIVNGKQVPL